MDQAVNAVLDADEDAELGDVFDRTLKDGALGVLLGHDIPRVGPHLLHAKRDALLLRIDGQHHHLDLVADVDHLARMPQLPGPGHLGDVDQAFDAGLKLDKGAVVHQIGNLAGEAGAFGVLAGDILPGIGHELLHAQGNLLLLLVEGQDLQFQLVAQVHQLLGMLDALPGHVRDVHEAVEAAQIHEHAVFGDVFHATGDRLALFQGLEQVLAHGVTALFQEHPAGHDDIAATTVNLQDAEFELLANQGVHVRHRTQIHVGTGQEGFDTAQVDRVAALDAAHDLAGDDVVLFLDFLELIKKLHPLGPLTGQVDGAFGFVLGHDVDIDLIAHTDFQLAAGILEFGDGDLALGLEVHVHQDVFFADADHDARGDGTFFEIAEILVEIILQGGFEVYFHLRVRVAFHFRGFVHALTSNTI